MFKLVVLSSVLALAAASPSALGLGIAGLGWGAPLSPLAAPLAGPLGVPVGPLAAIAGHGVLAAPAVAAAPVLGAYNYRGPLSLAPGQPASILAADGRPLDTLSVNLDRAAHLTARAINGAHLLKKRSAPLLAPAAWSHAARIDVPARLVAPAVPIAPLAAPAWGAPLALRAPVAAWGAPLGHAGAGGAPLAHAGAWGHLG